LWDIAEDRSPAAIAAEYRRNIESTWTLLRLTDRYRATFASVRNHVGFVGGYRKPIFDVIFPDWVEDQRGIVEHSLRNWVVPGFARMPASLVVSTTAS
jgi:hypothetical protein